MSDVKKIDISSVVDTMDNAVSSLKSSYEKTVASKNSTETDIEDLDEDKGFFEELLDDANDFKNDVLSDLADTCVTAITAVDSVLGKYEWYNDFIEFSNEKIVPFQNKVNEVLKRTGATVGTFFTSLLEGVGNLGEAFFDLTNIVRTVVFSIPTGIIDGVQAIGGAITGEEWESITKKMWNGTKAVVSQDLTTSLFDWFYNETDPGQFLKNNSYGFDTTRSIGSGIGKVAAIVGISIASGGTLAPFALAAMAGFGEGAEKSWAEGASIGEGLLSATLNSAWEGLQYYIGGKIGTTTLFGSSGKYLQNLNGEAFGTKLLNSFSRVMMDSADGGAEGIVQPLIAAIYKDGYYDESGNYIEFEDSDNFLDKYGEIFDDYGGVQNIFTNALVGGGASILGEAFDIGRFFNKNAGSEITAKLEDPDATVTLKLGDEITEKLQNVGQNVQNIKKFNNQSEIAEYFNDPRQYIISKLQSVYDSNPNNVKLKQSLQETAANIKNTPVREIDADTLYKNYSKYLSKEDKKTLKNLIKLDKLTNNYTDIEQDLLQSYSRSSGPVITAYNRKATTIFSGRPIDGTDVQAINDYLGRSFGDIGKYTKLSEYLDVDKFVNAMDNIIEKAPALQDDLTVYRSVGDIFLDGNKITTYDVGTRFNDQAFVSTSVIPKHISTKSPICLEIEIPKGTKALYLEKFTGVKNYSQQELLLGRNHEFEITSPLKYNPQTGQITLKAKLVTPKESIIKSLSLDTINTSNEALNYYNNFIRSGTAFDQSQIDINDVMKDFKDNGLLGRYESEIRDLYNRNLYNIDIPEHNIDHVERVLFYSMYMGDKLGLTPQQMNLLIEAAKYHDSGRINLKTDTNHAELSAIKSLEDLNGKYNSKDLSTIAAIIEFHEAGDTLNDVNYIFNKYNISPQGINDVYKVATILKDADALDRVRFPNNLQTKYLRNELANRLVKSSYQIQEIRAHNELENDFLNNKYSTKEMDNIVALKENGVSDYLIYFYNRYKTAPVYNMIMQILENGG